MATLLEIREVDGKPLYTYLSKDRRLIIRTPHDPRKDIYHTVFEPHEEFKKTHFLKCIQPFYDAVHNLKKEFEIREDDRDYQEGDRVILREYFPELDTYSGRIIECRITYLLRGTVYLKENYCAFGIDIIARSGIKYGDKHE